MQHTHIIPIRSSKRVSIARNIHFTSIAISATTCRISFACLAIPLSYLLGLLASLSTSAYLDFPTRHVPQDLPVGWASLPTPLRHPGRRALLVYHVAHLVGTTQSVGSRPASCSTFPGTSPSDIGFSGAVEHWYRGIRGFPLGPSGDIHRSYYTEARV